MVVRFIQSSDIADAQRLLGLYNVSAESSNDCGYKGKFWEKVSEAPFDLNDAMPKCQGVSQVPAQSGSQPNSPANNQGVNKLQYAHQSAGHKAAQLVNNPVVVKQQVNQADADGMQAITDLLASITNNKNNAVNTNNTITNYRIITTSTTQNSDDQLKALLTPPNNLASSNMQLTMPIVNTTQPYQIYTNSIQTTNSQPIVLPYTNNVPSDGGNSVQALLNQIKQFDASNNNGNNMVGGVGNGGARYNNQTRYTLGSVLSGTGKDKIMNPTVVGESASA